MDIKKNSAYDGDTAWGPRIPISIDTQTGIMTAGDASRPIDLNGDIDLALSSYLSMVYELRNASTGVIPLRQEDIISLSDAFEMEETHVTHRLAKLMHCDELQTKRFVQMVKKGRVLVPASMVAAGAVLALSFALSTNPAETNPLRVVPKTKANIEVVTTTSAPHQVSVDIGTASQVERATVTDEVSSQESNPTATEQGQDQTATNPAPNVEPGEVVIGDAIHISRDDGSQ
ncbi:MAG: hypothetical protein U0R17_02105 [Acidimicrobiia bacterium]